MDYIIFNILTAVVSTYIAIYLLRPLAFKINLLDIPNGRKNHEGHVPLIGGMAMYIGVAVSLLITSNELSQFYYFLVATGVILIVGILDDFHNITVSIRLLVQVLAAIFVATVADINIESFGNLFGSGEVFLNDWSYLITVIAIVAAINAINMSDGIHGLAGVSSLVTFLAIIYLSIGSASQEIILIVLLFCSVIPIFLVSNICISIDKSKRIFMGDAGSMLLGLSIAWVLIYLSQGGEERSFAPVTALWLFAFPLIEIGSVILRRLISRKSPFIPDSFHTHHILIQLGFSEQSTLVCLSFFSLSTSVIGVLGELYGVTEWVMFVGFILIALTYLLLHIFNVNKIQTGKVDTVTINNTKV